MSFHVYLNSKTVVRFSRPPLLAEQLQTYDEWRALGRQVVAGQRACSRRYQDQLPLFAKSQTRPRQVREAITIYSNDDDPELDDDCLDLFWSQHW